MAEASFSRTRVRWSDIDPLRLLWRGLVSVRFALGLIGFLALASLAGVLIPQLPVEMRGNPAAEAGWLEFQRGKFGALTGLMDALGLFQVFRSLWFISGLALLVASVCVCTANRLPPIWRNVFSPQTRVPDEYLQGGASVSVAMADVDTLSRELARRRYRVTMAREGDATYLFADRYPWAQFATFISHLALILFLAGGFVTVVTAREQQLFIAEGEAALPVFAVDDADHMQVAVQDAVGRFDETGFPLDFRTRLTVYRDGHEVAAGVTTVSDPLHFGGYTFHQSFYFPDGAQLKVRELASGRTVYDEVLALTATAATPQIAVRDDAGSLILEDAIIPTDFIADAAGTTVSIPGTGREFWIGARPGGEDGAWQLIVFETTAQSNSARDLLGPGQTARLGDLSLTFTGITDVPSLVVDSVPGLAGEGVAELSRGPAGDLLTIGPIAGRALALTSGESAVLGEYEYTFGGRREFSGITVRRDPGSTFIWVATGLFLAGLALTFYTPRRRLWGKIAAGQASFRGLGGRQLAVEREIREVAAKASAAE
jgi:cytochrome c biogenesis protein